MHRPLYGYLAVGVVGVLIGWGAGVLSSPRISLAAQAIHLETLHRIDLAQQHADDEAVRIAAVAEAQAVTATNTMAAAEVACDRRVWELARRWMIPQLATGGVRLTAQ